MTSWLGGSFIQWLCCIAVSLPFFVVAVRTTRRRERDIPLQGPVAKLALFLLVSLALTRMDPIWPFTKTLWQAMALEALGALVFIWATRAISRAGLTLNVSPKAWRISIVATGLLLLFVALRQAALKYTGLGASKDALVFEYLVYQMTMPGLAEELTYRGAIQPGLNRVFSHPWKLLGAQVGWGWIIASLVFWAPHAFRVDSDLHVSFYWPTLTMQLVAGFTFGWLRERTGSLLPPMIAHNLVNVLWTLM
jgi:membrane protease YdiL (CAAX protease family)